VTPVVDGQGSEPTAGEIARLAFVSEATVSRVLNHRPGVAPETRRRVYATMNRHGFPRHRGRAQRVGVIVPGVSNPVLADLVHHLESDFGAEGVAVQIKLSGESGTREGSLVEELCESGVDGLVFASCSNARVDADPATVLALQRRHIPFVTINGRFPGSRAPDVRVDDRHGAFLAIRHLAGQGHREIGMAAGPVESRPAREREDGWRRAMHDLGLPIRPELVLNSGFEIVDGERVGPSLFEAGASAVVAANDLLAIGVVAAARRRGLAVPADVSVVGFDDSTILRSSGLGLTSVRQPALQMARAAADALVELMAGGQVVGDRTFLPALVLRESTAVNDRIPRACRRT
jgi:LacI family transcriptional regulator, repressor for deo operon, udp, cdd, tsx, nupC, and nupG